MNCGERQEPSGLNRTHLTILVNGIAMLEAVILLETPLPSTIKYLEVETPQREQISIILSQCATNTTKTKEAETSDSTWILRQAYDAIFEDDIDIL